MANVRFILGTQNPARRIDPAAALPKLINGDGTYTNAPPKVEAVPFYMANALNADRSASVWVTPSHPATTGFSPDVVFDMDLGAAKSITGAGVLGFQTTPGGFPTQMQFYFIASPGAYDGNIGFSAPTPYFTALNAGFRDEGILFPAISARYIRFRFPIAASGLGFSVASFYIVVGMTDIGFLYSRATETIVQPKSVIEGYGQIPTITKTGVLWRRFLLTYENIDQATRDTFDSLMREVNPFIYLDPDGNTWEVVPDEEFARDHIWAPPSRYTFSFGMRSLP